MGVFIDPALKGHLAWPLFVVPCFILEGGAAVEQFDSLCKNHEFRRAYARGKSFVSPMVVVYVLKNRCRALRVGITTSKKIGNAVQRNRARRVIREAFRQILPQVRTGYDIVFVARGRTPFVKSTEVRRHMLRQLKEAGLLIKDQTL